MQYLTIPVTAFQQNCSIIWCETTKECAFVDPGGDADVLIAAVEARGLHPIGVFLTHAHLDHVGGTLALATHYHIPISGPHPADKYWLDALPVQAQQFGLPHCDAFVPDRWLAEGDTLSVWATAIGSPAYARTHPRSCGVVPSGQQGIVRWGCAVQRFGIGRSDFPGGNHRQLNRLYKA